MGSRRMKKLAPLLSLLALGALGLVVFEGGDDKTTAGSEIETAGEGYVNLRPNYRQGFKKSCGKFGRWSLVVIDRASSLAEVSCREARGVMDAMTAGGVAVEKLPGGWICSGPDAYVECFDLDPATGEAENTIRARVRRSRAAEAQAKLSPEEQVQELKRAANDWASLFAKDVWAACQYTYGRQAPSCSKFSLGSGGGPHDRPSAFQKSFADATVESVAVKGDKAWAEFSNGELGEFIRVAKTELPLDTENAIQKIPPGWYIYRVGGNAGKKYFEP
jgi:hypothetical protein